MSGTQRLTQFSTNSNRQLVFILLAFFLSELVFSRIIGQESYSRILQMGQAISQFSILSVCLFSYIFLSKEQGSKWILPIQIKVILPFLLVFFLTSIIASIIGVLRQHETKYVIGDAYKFISLPLFICFFVTAINDIWTLKRVLRATLWIYGIFALFYTSLYLTTILDFHRRPMLIYTFPFMPPILIYLKSFLNRKEYLLLSSIYIFTFPCFLWFSQSLSFLLQNAFILLFSVFFYRGIQTIFTARHILKITVAAIIVATIGYYSLVSFLDGLAGTELYLLRKFYFIFNNGMTLQTLELIGGDRVAHFVAVIKHFRHSPYDLLFGQGMGGLIQVESISGLEDRVWKPVNHFVEGGYPEVFLRTGILGFLSYFGLIAAILRSSIRYSRNNFMISFCSAYFLYALIFSVLNFGFIVAGIGSLFMVSLLISSVILAVKYETLPGNS